jgi:hypothetical protein
MSGQSNGNGNGFPHLPRLTEEQEGELLDAISLGMPIQRALEMVGIPVSSFHLMYAAAEKARGGKLKDFLERLARARARGEYSLLKRVEQGGKGTANRMWILERSFGYWRTERQESQVEHSGGVEITVKRAKVGESDRPQ